jgi:nitrogen fixation NifU-like protein
MPLDDLYREIILEHFRSPRNKGRLEKPDISAEGVNPLCGDQLKLSIALAGDRIIDLKIEGHGCSISQASGSMMTEAVKGKTIPEAQHVAQAFKALMLENGVTPGDVDLGDLEALEGVKQYPVRIKCAILAWNTLLGGLATRAQGGRETKLVEE